MSRLTFMLDVDGPEADDVAEAIIFYLTNELDLDIVDYNVEEA